MNGFSVNDVVDAIAAVATYARQKALYEADCEVRAKLSEARAALYESRAVGSRLATVDLARCKYKLSKLTQYVSSLPPEMQCQFDSLIHELEGRIGEARSQRVGFA